jgi:hypothetical protein
VIQEAWVSGVSTRRVDDLVQAMGLAGISKSTVSKLCRDIDERVGAFLDRPLAGDWPYLWLDATYLKQREGGRIVSVAVIIAVAANTDGKREIVGLHIGPSEAETFWAGFLKSLVRRGLRGVKLVISDAHEGLKAAIRRVMGASWQRCRVHWMRNAQAYVAKGQQSMVSAALRQTFIRDCLNFRVCPVGEATRSGHCPGKALAEEDGKLGLCHGPFTWRHDPLLFGPVQDQEQQLQCRLVGREVAPCPDGPAQLGVQRLDGIRGV